MEVSVVYVLSQLCVVIYYVLVMSTYQIKSRKKILIINMIAMSINGISYICLSAYSGLSMVVLGLIRNVLFYVNEIWDKGDTRITRREVIELVVLIVLAVVFSLLTYEGPLSLMSVVATLTYTVSLWQKNTKVYRILGIPIGIAGITYNIYIKSILGAIFEGFSLASAVVGYFREIFRKK